MIKATVKMAYDGQGFVRRDPELPLYCFYVECDTCFECCLADESWSIHDGIKDACQRALDHGWLITVEQDVCAKCVQKSVHVV